MEKSPHVPKRMSGKVLQSIRQTLRAANARARLPCTENHARSSTTPEDRFYKIFVEEIANGRPNQSAILEDLDVLLKSTMEKRRLTVDWRESMMDTSELIQATARRVGFHPPELASLKKNDGEKTD